MNKYTCIRNFNYMSNDSESSLENVEQTTLGLCHGVMVYSALRYGC